MSLVPTSVRVREGKRVVVWQEWIFVVGNFAQTIMIWPMIVGPEKPPVRSSAPLAISLAAFSFAFMTLDLWLSAAGVGAAAIAWAVLVVQKLRQH